MEEKRKKFGIIRFYPKGKRRTREVFTIPKTVKPIMEGPKRVKRSKKIFIKPKLYEPKLDFSIGKPSLKHIMPQIRKRRAKRGKKKKSWF